jgi:TolB protein
MRLSRTLWLWLGLVALLLSGCAGRSSAGAIAFESRQGDSSDILLLSLADQKLTTLVSDPAWDGTPAISPDGKRLAFASDRDGDPEIFVMNMDGSGLVKLTDNTAADYMPAWSPDGTRIAFVSDRTYFVPLEGGNLEVSSGLELYVMDADGRNVVRLTGDQNDVSLYPSWSPDGQKIAYMNVSNVAHIYVVDVNPENPQPRDLTPELTISAWSPRWSPDGKYIIFMGDDQTKKGIYRMDADGGNLVELTRDWPAYAVDPAWSPDGRRIVFASNPGGAVNLYTMTPDGKDIQQLTKGSGYYALPSWSR